MKTKTKKLTLRLGLVCDGCGLTISEEFTGQGLGGAAFRAWAVRQWAESIHGWSCIEGLDRCEECAAAPAASVEEDVKALMRSVLRDMDLAALQLRAGKFLDASATFADVKASVFQLDKLVGK
ncbi:hypothetical protein VB1_CDS0057 [Arthrobacter phage Marchesin]|nr:hypothetical protein VB1_CDS0057 [Arthrobacter phage Marchesin]